MFRPWQKPPPSGPAELKPQPEVKGNLLDNQARPHDSDSPAVVEDLLPQLLGEEEVPLKSSDNRLADSSKAFESLEDAIRSGNKTLREEIEKNSRSIRCLNKNLEEQHKTLISIKDTLENLVSFIRTNAREDRRRKERKEEERRKEREEDRRRDYQEKQRGDRKRRMEDCEEHQNPHIKSVLGDVKINKRRKDH